MNFLLKSLDRFSLVALQRTVRRRLWLALFVLAVATGTLQAQITLTVDAPNTPVSCGSTVTYYIRANGFDANVNDLQFTIGWDAAKLAYVSSDNNPSGVYNAGSSSTPELPLLTRSGTDKLTYVWGDLLAPYNVAINNGDPIVSLTFTVLSFGNIPLSITGSPTEILAADHNFDVINVSTNTSDALNSNTVCSMALVVDAPASAVSCGSQFTYDIKANGFTGNVNDLQFSVKWDNEKTQIRKPRCQYVRLYCRRRTAFDYSTRWF